MAFRLWLNMPNERLTNAIATEAMATPTGDVVLTGNALNLQLGYFLIITTRLQDVLRHAR